MWWQFELFRITMMTGNLGGSLNGTLRKPLSDTFDWSIEMIKVLTVTHLIVAQSHGDHSNSDQESLSMLPKLFQMNLFLESRNLALSSTWFIIWAERVSRDGTFYEVAASVWTNDRWLSRKIITQYLHPKGYYQVTGNPVSLVPRFPFADAVSSGRFPPSSDSIWLALFFEDTLLKSDRW